MINSANVDLSSRILGQVITYIVLDILHSPVATQGNSGNWIHSNVVQQRNCHSISNIFEHFLGKWWALAVVVHFRPWVSYWRFVLDRPLALYQFWSQSVDSSPIMVVALESVTVSDSCGSLESYSR